MPVEVIDTLEIAHDLRSAGLTEPQAEAIARHFKRRYEADRQELVTREYLDHALERLRTELRDEINDVRGEVSSLRAHLDKELASIRGEFRSEIASFGPRSRAAGPISSGCCGIACCSSSPV